MPYEETADSPSSEQSKDGQITQELNKCDEKLEFLAKTIERLKQRLTTILMKKPEQAEGVAKDEQALCKIAERIRSQRTSVGYSIRKISSIIERVEL